MLTEPKSEDSSKLDITSKGQGSVYIMNRLKLSNPKGSILEAICGRRSKLWPSRIRLRHRRRVIDDRMSQPNSVGDRRAIFAIADNIKKCCYYRRQYLNRLKTCILWYLTYLAVAPSNAKVYHKYETSAICEKHFRQM